MINVMATGSIFREIEVKTSSKDRPYVTGSLKVIEGTVVSFVRFVAFNDEARVELESLGDGDKVTITGRLEASAYMQSGGGGPRVSLKIIADRALCLKPLTGKATGTSRRCAKVPKRDAPATTRTGNRRTQLPSDDGLPPWAP